jgi:hypothetical protein
VQIDRANTVAGAPRVELGWDREADRSSGPDEGQLGDAADEREVLRYAADSDWRLIGTYNALDAQRVFRMGQALGRRFMRVPVPPISEKQFREALAAWTVDLPDRVGDVLCGLYGIHLESEVPLGPAVFLRAASYVVNGLRLELGHAEADDLSGRELDGDVEGLLAEAYVLAVGVVLAQLPGHELERIQARVLADEIFDGAQWAFVTEQLASLA